MEINGPLRQPEAGWGWFWDPPAWGPHPTGSASYDSSPSKTLSLGPSFGQRTCVKMLCTQPVRHGGEGWRGRLTPMAQEGRVHDGKKCDDVEMGYVMRWKAQAVGTACAKALGSGQGQPEGGCG